MKADLITDGEIAHVRRPQQMGRLVDANFFEQTARRLARRLGERPFHIERAQVDMLGNLLEFERPFVMREYERRHVMDERARRAAIDLGLTSFARPKAGRLRCRFRLIKIDILSLRFPRAARGPTVNPGRLDRGIELSVIRRVTGEHFLPLLFKRQHLGPPFVLLYQIDFRSLVLFLALTVYIPAIHESHLF